MNTSPGRLRVCGGQPRPAPASRPVASALALAAAGLLAFSGTASAANNPGTGDSGFFTFRPSATIGGTQINVASGNALVRTRDLSDSLLNYHVVVDRAYNSLAPDTFSILSPRWAYDVGPATGLTVESNQDVTVTGPSGYRIRFARQSDGSYDPPDGFDGSLTKTSAGWTLARTSQGDEFGFDNSGTLTWTKDAAARDFTVQGTSAAGRTVLSSYGTASGRRVNVSYTGDSLVREMDDPSSGHHYYRYTAGRLTAYESPSGQVTGYRYDSNGLLDKITEPGGTTVELDVAASGRVRSITTTLPGGFPQTTSFVYTRRTYKSDVTGPDSVRRTYAYDDDWRVTRQYNPDEVPSVTASAELRDLAGGYVGPNRTYPVEVAATQPDGAGLRRLWLTLVPESELAGENVPCTTTPFDLVCPQTYDVPLDIDFAPLPEGPTTLRGAALDDEQNRGNSAVWEVTVDKTAPVDVAASGELFDAHDGYINGQGIKAVTVSAVDPGMADGTRLSGIKRLQLEDVGRGIVAATDVSCTALACPVTASETLNVDTSQLPEGARQLRIVATDLVGNVSRSAPWTVTVDKTPPNVPPNMDATFNPEDGITDLTWDRASDPVLPGSAPGSGVAAYQYRYRTTGGAWSAWVGAGPDDDFYYEVPGLTDGQQLNLEVKAIDAVGNVREASQTLTVSPSQLTPDDVGAEAAWEVDDPLPASSNTPEPASWSNVDPGEGGSTIDPDEGSDAADSARPALSSGGSSLDANPLVSPDGWENQLCGALGPSPCGTYRGRIAAKYTLQYWNTSNSGQYPDGTRRNHDYPYFGSDCTNFVSQALHFGNFHFMRTAPGVNDPRSNGHDRGSGYFRGNSSWWSFFFDLGGRNYSWSNSFSVSWVLAKQLVDTGLGTIVNGQQGVRPGDVIFYRLHGGKIDHAQMVVKVTHRAIWVAQHTADYYRTLKSVHKSVDANFAGHGPSTIVRPRYTRFNLDS